MNRDIKFSKKASTPNGAAEMVAKHNSTKAKKWHLNLINPNGPIDANNFTDINGDGISDITDLARIKLHLIDKSILSGINYEAGDVDRDKRISINDLAFLKLVLLDLKNFE